MPPAPHRPRHRSSGASPSAGRTARSGPVRATAEGAGGGEGAADRRRRAGRIVRRLAQAYPDVRTALRFRNPFELLVATILSAQCTDKKVNEVTAELFRLWPTPAALAAAAPGRVEEIIHPTGFYRQKAKSIQSVACDLVERFGGTVPRSLDDLVSLRGVARKTANVVLGNAFDVPGLAVDTHVQRVAGRLGLTAETDPVKIERDLAVLLAPAEWTAFSNRTIHHGRVCCVARAPHCERCPLAPDCPWPSRGPAGAVPPRPAGRRGRRGSA
jgi:endonuclease-3